MTLATTSKPEPRLLKQNVYVDRVVALTAAVGRGLVGLSNDLAFRSNVSAAGLAEVRTRLASALATLNEVATEANAADSGLLLDGADAYDAAALSAKRKENA